MENINPKQANSKINQNEIHLFAHDVFIFMSVSSVVIVKGRNIVRQTQEAENYFLEKEYS